ncbi:ATPase [Deinococcus sonorensis]|uniref:ATPase n=2 Tax=Deinococcus sonorensis TaxID=309891 RepID=A0AAU7UAD4_9DEIO
MTQVLLPGLLPSDAAPPGWTALALSPLLVLVGVTGVGKSTALATLGGPAGQVLPDRREVTDAVMIRSLSAGPVTDREERFRLTARYREQHPGGMAQALGGLAADPQVWPGPLIFDGLRGLDEVQYAAQHYPSWRFVSLHAPDVVRVRRLLGRADHFDRVEVQLDAAPLLQQLQALTGSAAVFWPDDLQQLAALAQEGHRPDDILAKTRIVLSERLNYDPAAARAALSALPPERVLDLDTVALSPAEVAARLEAWR